MFWRGLFGYLPVQAISALVGFGSIVVFTRLLTPEGYGHYALAFAVGALVQTAMLTWTEAAAARFQVAELERGDVDTKIATLQRTALVLALISAAGTWAVLRLLPLDPALEGAVLMAVAAFGVRGVTKLNQERKRAVGDVRGYAVMEVVFTGGGFLLGVGFIWAGAGAAGVFAGSAVAALALLLAIAPHEIRRSARGRFDPERLRRYAAYGVPVSLSLILALVLSSTDRFVIAAFLDEASVGAYHAGFSVGSRLLDVVWVWLGMAGAPAMVAALERGGPRALAAVAREQAEVMVLLAVPAAAGLALVSGPLVEIMVGEGLRTEAALVAPWVALAVVFSGFSAHYLTQAFTLGQRTGLLLPTVAVPAVVNLLLAVLLVPRFGVLGAAWSTTISLALGSVVAAWLGRRVLLLPIPWSAAGRAGLASGVMAAAVLTLPTLGGWSELILKAAVGATAYAAVLLAIDPGARRRLMLLRPRRSRPA